MNIIIHTCEINHQIIREEALSIMDVLSFPEWKKNKIIYAHSSKKHNVVPVSINNIILSHPTLGIKAVKITYIRQDLIAAYYITLRIELNHMLTHRKEMQLFQCTKGNLTTLYHNFTAAMIELLPEFPALQGLHNWTAARLDYTFDFRFNSCHEVNLFLLLSKHSSKYVRTKELHDKENSRKDQSTSEYNKSSKAIIYNKYRQVSEVYTNAEQNELDSYLAAVDNVVRFEIQCSKGKLSTIKQKYSLPSRSIIYFLNDSIGNDLIHERYQQMVGEGDFYNAYYAESIIKSSFLRPSTKSNLINIQLLISQSRHFNEARKDFVAGRVIGKTADKIEVKGRTAVTFDNRCKLLRSLNIHPVRIPKDVASKTKGLGITHLVNPLPQLTAVIDATEPLPIDFWDSLLPSINDDYCVDELLDWWWQQQ